LLSIVLHKSELHPAIVGSAAAKAMIRRIRRQPDCLVQIPPALASF
jgi:hypothetical protein